MLLRTLPQQVQLLLVPPHLAPLIWRQICEHLLQALLLAAILVEQLWPAWLQAQGCVRKALLMDFPRLQCRGGLNADKLSEQT